MNPFLRVIDALNRHNVRYVIVGGFAAYLHGTRRLTVDLDIVVDLSPEEARKAIDALLAAGLSCRLPVDPYQFADAQSRASWIRDKHMTVFTMIDPVTPGFVVDLFVEPPKEFDVFYGAASVLEIEGRRARIAAIDDLIEMKRRAGRPQDLLDVESLCEIKSLRAPR